jgi:hypothetical protein
MLCRVIQIRITSNCLSYTHQPPFFVKNDTSFFTVEK